MTFALAVVSLCVVAWALTLNRSRTIQWSDVRKNNGIALSVWLMMVFFSITMIFLIKKFSNFFDTHTLNNLDRLISYCSILIGIYFGAAASVEAVGKSPDRIGIRGLRYLLILTILALAWIYIFFISRIPNIEYYVPRSFPEVLFMFITFAFGAVLCLFVGKVYLSYLPLEKSPVMRTRARLIVASSLLACAYFLIKIATVGGYFWPTLASQALVDISSLLLVISALTHFSALLSNKLYLPLVMLSRNIEGWNALSDLKYLIGQLQLLCPEVVFSTSTPTILHFLLNPEYHLYRAIIVIMDGKTMLDDLMLEGALEGEPALWEGDMLREAVRVKLTLQSIDPSGDFWKIVSEYRNASRGLIQGQYQILIRKAARQ